MPRFYLTTAIDYVNSRPHLGTAYEKVVRRRHRPLQGVARRRHVLSDGQRRALAECRARGKSEGHDAAGVHRRDPEWLRQSVRAPEHLERRLHPDDPAAAHKAAVTASVQRIYDAGDIYEGAYEGWYCVGCEAFKPEKELVNGRCPDIRSGAAVDQGEELFLPALEYQKPLLEHFQKHPDFFEPDTRRNEAAPAARKRSRRHLDQPGVGQAWGIPVPGIRRASSTSGSTRLPTTPPPWASGRSGDASTAGGRPTCT